MLCTAADVAAIRQPAGPAHYEAGRVKLADGTTFEVGGDANGKAFLANVKTGDRINVCFAGPQRWADEPPDARQAWAYAERRNVTLATVGVPGANAQQVPLPANRRRTL